MPRTDRQFEHFSVGDYVTFKRRFSAADFIAFRSLSGDGNPLHHDAAYAGRTRFGQPIVPLHLLALPLSAIAGVMIPGHRAFYLGSGIRALSPALYGEELTYSARVTSAHKAQRTLQISAIAFRGATVILEAELRVQVRDDPPRDAWQEEAPPVRNARSDRTAWVTGATGHIGSAIARQLAASGWNLVLIGHRDGGAAEALARECGAKGVQAKAHCLDLSQPAAIKKVLAAAPDAAALVHAASPPIDAAPESLFAVNCSALQALAERVLPGMLGRQHGRILFIGSSAVQHAPPGWDDYAASKAAASTIVEALHRRYSPYDIQAMTLAPGFVMTPFSERYRDRSRPGLVPGEVAEAAMALLERGSIGAADTYVWMEPHNVLKGRYGFHVSAPASPAASAAAHAPARDTAPQPASQEGIDAEVRRFFRLPADSDLSAAGLNLTPGWDSLRHIELMLHLETAFGLAFTSAEMEKTVRYADLTRLIGARLKDAGG